VALFGALGAIGLAPRQVSERLTGLGENFLLFDARTATVNPMNFSLVERMAHWQAGWSMAIDHPLVGVGPGNYEVAYDRYYLPGWPLALGHAHNIYINTFAELGLLGLAAFLLFLGTLFARIIRALRRTARESVFQRIALLATLGAVTAFSTHNMFDNMFVHAIGIQFGLLIGFAEAIAGEQDENETWSG
jgi:O-antigen ligase